MVWLPSSGRGNHPRRRRDPRGVSALLREPTNELFQRDVAPVGRFLFDGVLPGEYRLIVPPTWRLNARSVWAEQQLSVSGAPNQTVFVATKPTMEVTGRILFDGQPMLLDFNLAHDPHAPERAESALRGGTLPYMAPEQLEAFRDPSRWEQVGPTADLYALGLTLYYALAAELPDRGQPASGGSGYRPSSVVPGVPEWLDDVVARATAPAPEDRFPSAAALEEALAGEGAQAAEPAARCALCGGQDPFGAGLCPGCGGGSPPRRRAARAAGPPGSCPRGAR